MILRIGVGFFVFFKLDFPVSNYDREGVSALKEEIRSLLREGSWMVVGTLAGESSTVRGL